MALYNRSSNPFENDDDDDDSFDSRYRAKQNQGRLEPSEKDRRQQIWQQVQESESRQLESTRNALASIYESESMGVATADELLRQGEQLDNIERKTTDINQTMKTSQRHLNNIKSVFGGIKNWWTGGSEKKQADSSTATASKGPSSESKLHTTLEEHKKSAPHPAARLKYDTRGFYEDGEDEDIDTRFMAGAKKPASGSSQHQQMITHITNSEYEEEVDKNLGMMSDGMARLKGLAMGLGTEIERQNAQLDRINLQTDKATVTLDDQLAQMRKLQHR